jgi:hypothetical protein
MKFVAACLIACACALPVAAGAQWQWIDAQGKKVFSDQPPPMDVPDKNVLKRPGKLGAAPAPTSAPTASDAAPPAPAKTSGVDKDLEEKKRKADEAEKAKRAAEEQKIAAARADNCARARQGKATLDSGIRLARVNAQGEREFLDDDARAAEQQRLQAVIASDCQ